MALYPSTDTSRPSVTPIESRKNVREPPESDTLLSAREGRAIVVCDQWLGSNGYAGMKALRRAGWSVAVVPEWEYVPVQWRGRLLRGVGRALRRLAVADFNAALLRCARELEPELLLVFKGTFVKGETLRHLRRQGVATYCFYPDVSVYTHGPYLPGALPEYDWIFTTKSFGLRDLRTTLGIERVSLLLHAFDRDLHRPLELSPGDHARYGCDVSFIGTWSLKKELLLASLAARCSDVRLRVWGAQWHRANGRQILRRAVQDQEVRGDEYVKAIRGSTINLAILSERRPGASEGDQITSRTFHIPACGAFMLHERSDELLTLLQEGVEVECFGDVDELEHKVRQYLGDPGRREEIAARGAGRIRAAHSWDDRIQEILRHHRNRS